MKNLGDECRLSLLKQETCKLKILNLASSKILINFSISFPHYTARLFSRQIFITAQKFSEVLGLSCIKTILQTSGKEQGKIIFLNILSLVFLIS